MQELRPLPPHLVGGNFLLAETEPTVVFTPEDLSSEQRLMAQTAEKFMEKEVLPNVDALEHAYREYLAGRAGASPHSQPLRGALARLLRG